MLNSWMFSNSQSKAIRGTLFAAVLCCGGCQPQPANSNATEPAPIDHKEYWDAIYFDENKVGYAHTVYDSVTQDGRRLLRITTDSQLAIQRFAETTRQQLRYSSTETPDGEVVRFDSSMASGDSKAAGISLEATGEVRDNQIELRLTTLGKAQTATLPWNKEWGGYFAMEQSLERLPLQPGEQRKLRALMPGFNQTAEVEFSAEQYESTETLDGPRDLLRIASKVTLDRNTLEQTIWTDRHGQTIKTLMPALKQVTYRTTKERALAKSTGTFDLGERTIVKVDRVLDQPHQTSRVVYRATVSSGDARTLFVSGATQTVKPLDQRSVEIVVRSLRPASELGDFPRDTPPTPDDLAPNNLIQSDDEQVIKLSQEIAPDKTAPWEIAVAMEQRVREMIRKKNFSQALSSAAEVVRSREGDCTEHAVLLAALCRARQIPARVAIGLVYYRPSGGFAYHMWTEAWMQDRWVPLDATLGLGGIGAAHLVVSRSNLKGVDPLTQFLPVLQLLGNLKLEVVSAD